MPQNNSAQTEHNQPKTLNDLHTAFAELAFSYGMTCRGEIHLSDLAILQADCTLLACVTQELKNQIVGGAL